MNQALVIIADAEIGFEVVYAGEEDLCPLCRSLETQQAA